MPSVRKSAKIVTRHDHTLIQQKCQLTGSEDYAVVIQKGKGFWNKSVHVFSRQPTLKELQEYEESSSRLRFKGQKAEMEGSPIAAASDLYNKLVERVYDVLVGLKSHDKLLGGAGADLGAATGQAGSDPGVHGGGLLGVPDGRGRGDRDRAGRRQGRR